MACYCPLKGWRSKHVSPTTGRRGIVFNLQEGLVDLPMDVPCGQCVGCRIDRSQQWAIRCMHESSDHLVSSFITLTYDDDHLPYGGTLVLDDYQRFMKRLRRSIAPARVRFFHCGEYGDTLFRPHYHAILFGYRPTDGIPVGESLWFSPTLSSLWPFGFASFGNVTFESCAYVARYIMKKITGDRAMDHYQGVDFRTAEIVPIAPEYTTMSRRPGIGMRWYDKFKSEVYPSDSVVMRGREMKPPKAYDRRYQFENPDGYEEVAFQRLLRARRWKSELTPERLLVREQVKKAQISTLTRKL